MTERKHIEKNPSWKVGRIPATAEGGHPGVGSHTVYGAEWHNPIGLFYTEEMATAVAKMREACERMSRYSHHALCFPVYEEIGELSPGEPGGPECWCGKWQMKDALRLANGGELRGVEWCEKHRVNEWTDHRCIPDSYAESDERERARRHAQRQEEIEDQQEMVEQQRSWAMEQGDTGQPW